MKRHEPILSPVIVGACVRVWHGAHYGMTVLCSAKQIVWQLAWYPCTLAWERSH